MSTATVNFDVRPSGYITIAAMRETAERYESDLPEASWFLKYRSVEKAMREEMVRRVVERRK